VASLGMDTKKSTTRLTTLSGIEMITWLVTILAEFLKGRQIPGKRFTLPKY